MNSAPTSYAGISFTQFDGNEITFSAALRERGWKGVYEQRQGINVYKVKNRPGETILGITIFEGGLACRHYLATTN